MISLIILDKIKLLKKTGKGSLEEFLSIFGFNFSSLKKLSNNLTKNELDEFNMYLTESSFDFNNINIELRNFIIKILKVLIYYRKELKLEDLISKYDKNNDSSNEIKLEKKSYRYKMFINENNISTDKTFLDAFYKLTIKQKKYLGLYFGIDCESKDQKEIASIYKDNFYNVCNIISVAKKDLLKYIDEKKVKSNVKFKEFLIENNISAEDFNKAFNLLKPKQKEYLKLFLGFNCKPLTLKEICELKKLSYSGVYNSINIAKENIIKYIKIGKINKTPENTTKRKAISQETLQLFLENNCISREDFNKAINLLGSKQKEYIELYFGIKGTILSLKEISELKSISYTSVYSTIKQAKNNIIKFIKTDKINKPIEKQQSLKKEVNINDFLESNSISREEFDKAIELIGKKQRECLKLYFGIDCRRLSVSDISKTLGKNYSTVNNNIINGKQNIVKNIKYNSIKNINNQTLDEFLEENDITREEFDRAIELIGEKQRECLKLYFGIDCRRLSVSDISKTLGKKYSTVNNNIILGKQNIVKNIQNGKIKEVKIKLLKNKLNELYKFLLKNERFKKIVIETNPIGATALSLVSEFNFNLAQLSKVLYMSKNDVIELLMQVSQIADNYDNDTEKIDDLCFCDNNDKKYDSSYKI